MNEELYHHGIKGMKWGVRRYETSSGHLTAAGKKRYGDGPVGKVNKQTKQAKDSPEAQAKREQRKATAKKVAKGAAIVGGTVLAAYGAKKAHDYIRDENTKIHIKRCEQEFRRNNRWHNEVLVNDLHIRATTYGDKNYRYNKPLVDINRHNAIESHNKRAYRLTALDRAASDSFVTAARNVANDRKYKRNVVKRANRRAKKRRG